MNTENFELIRGQRIADQMLLSPEYLGETTFSTLFNNIKSTGNFPTAVKRQFATQPQKVTEIKITPFLGTKTLLIRSIVNSDSGKQYQTILSFLRVTYEDEDTDDNVTFTGSNGEVYHIQQINLKDIDVHVRCECLDFRWRFAKHNNKDGSLYGRPHPPYKPKTNRIVNKNKVPGVCKHLLASIQAQYEAGLVTHV